MKRRPADVGSVWDHVGALQAQGRPVPPGPSWDACPAQLGDRSPQVSPRWVPDWLAWTWVPGPGAPARHVDESTPSLCGKTQAVTQPRACLCRVETPAHAPLGRGWRRKGPTQRGCGIPAEGGLPHLLRIRGHGGGRCASPAEAWAVRETNAQEPEAVEWAPENRLPGHCPRPGCPSGTSQHGGVRSVRHPLVGD